MKITITTPSNNPSQPHFTDIAERIKQALARFKLRDADTDRVSVESDGVVVIVEETEGE